MKNLSRILAALAVALCPMASPAAAVGSTDYSDLWWNPAESGWGAHITLQGDVLFMVLYVYDAAGQPRFFVAPDTRLTDLSAYAPGTYLGALYSTRGPAFAGAFDPASVSTQEVGNVQVTFASPSTAQLRYTVAGATITKVLSRQAWRAPDIAGDFKGGLFATATPATCPFGIASISYPGSFKVRRAGDTVTIDHTFSPGFDEQGTCRYTGRAVQAGSLLSIVEGSYACEFLSTNTAAGTFQMTAIESGPNGFSGRYGATEGAACQHTGYFGGVRRGYRDSDLPPTPEEE